MYQIQQNIQIILRGRFSATVCIVCIVRDHHLLWPNGIHFQGCLQRIWPVHGCSLFALCICGTIGVVWCAYTVQGPKPTAADCPATAGLECDRDGHFSCHSHRLGCVTMVIMASTELLKSTQTSNTHPCSTVVSSGIVVISEWTAIDSGVLPWCSQPSLNYWS